MGDLGGMLRETGVILPADRLAALDTYRQLLIDWNSRMDLTNVPPADIDARHFLDSLWPLGVEGLFPAGCRAIDVGSGAGFPGLALAVARPDLRWTLLEAQGKRCAFLNAVKERLGLSNVAVIQDRAETLGRDAAHREQYDRAAARAVAPLNVLSEYLLPFVQVGGMAVCWKGPALKEEQQDGIAAARALGGAWLEPVAMPGADNQRLLARIQKTEKTLPLYPRKNGTPAKRPLKDDKK